MLNERVLQKNGIALVSVIRYSVKLEKIVEDNSVVTCNKNNKLKKGGLNSSRS